MELLAGHHWLTWVLLGLDLALRVYFSARVIQRRLPVGVAWAWLFLILFLPVAGTLIYLYLGEYRMSRRRRERMQTTETAIRRLFAKALADHKEEDQLPPAARTFACAVNPYFGTPVLGGNDIELLKNADIAFPALIADIDNARESVDLEFYIYTDGGRAGQVTDALLRAAGRGVKCRLLVDFIGSKAFASGPTPAKLKAAGIEYCAALPSGLLKSFIARPDLRIHRKIVVIDHSLAYTGSMNVADPLTFKQDSGVGHWVDALARVRGPAAQALRLVFLSDWCAEMQLDFESEEGKSQFKDTATIRGARIHCLPSGPAVTDSAIEQVLLMAIYAARTRLVLTTPYFVPSESMYYALVAAARRGVKVTLIVPEKVDSHLTQWASRAFLRDLAEAGVHVALYRAGLLHTKSVLVDNDFTLFGSLNLDPRSLRINFEITLIVYDSGFLTAIAALQDSYLKESTLLQTKNFKKRDWITKSKENLARLASPVL